jgi:hypothetical protein
MCGYVTLYLELFRHFIVYNFLTICKIIAVVGGGGGGGNVAAAAAAAAAVALPPPPPVNFIPSLWTKLEFPFFCTRNLKTKTPLHLKLILVCFPVIFSHCHL